MSILIKSKPERPLNKRPEGLHLLGLGMLTGGISIAIFAAIIGIRLSLAINDLIIPITTTIILLTTAFILILTSKK